MGAQVHPARSVENAGSSWERAAETIERSCLAAARGSIDEPRAVLLLNDLPGPDREALCLRTHSSVAARGGTMIRVACLGGGPDAFGSLRPILEELVPVACQEAPHLPQLLGAEIEAIHPELAARLGIVPSHSLPQIAVTPSERRSHRESERAFRIINGLARLVHEAVRVCPSLSRGPLVVWWDDLHAADRPSVLAFRRLGRWAGQARGPVVVVGTLDPDGIPAIRRPALPAHLQGFFDWPAQRRALLGAVREQLLGVEEDLRTSRSAVVAEDGGLEDGGSMGGPEVGDGSAGSRGLVGSAFEHFGEGRVEEGCAYAIRATAPSAFSLDYEAILALASLIVAALGGSRDGPFDQDRFDTAWERSGTGDRYPALEFSVSPARSRAGALMAAWKATAFAHTCLGDHETALEAYARALDFADTPALRAQVHMYLGLMAGKRLFRLEEADDFLARGFDQVEGQNDEECTLERGWLLNVSALMAFQRKRFREAMLRVQEARTRMRPLHGSEPTHLKINLISNISVLFEMTGRIDRAAETWSFFRTFIRDNSELFAKHYFYREGGLALKAGRMEDALASFEQSFGQSMATTDHFHGDIAARACAYVAYRRGDLEEAERWYERSADLRLAVGDHAGAPRSLCALALVRALRGDRDEARAALDAALDTAERAGEAGEVERTVREAGRWLDGDVEAVRQEWERILEPPGTKLNRPFSLVNPYEAEQAG